MNPFLRPGAVAAAAILVSGCVEFEEQTLSFVHVPDTDTLRVFQEYRGICGRDRADGLSAAEQDQLESVLTTPRTFFFANWILEIDHRALREWHAELGDPGKRRRENLSDEAAARFQRVVAALLAHSKIENGPFYLDAGNRLGAVQSVTFTRVGEILRALNEAMPDTLRSLAAEKDTTPEDAAVWLAAAEAPGTFFRLDGNRITVTWPISRRGFDRAFGPEADSRARVEAFRAQGGTVAFADDAVTLSIGSPSADLTSLTLPVSDEPASGNATAHVRARSLLDAGFDPDAARDRFLRPGR
jgi:hypothetical protein